MMAKYIKKNEGSSEAQKQKKGIQQEKRREYSEYNEENTIKSRSREYSENREASTTGIKESTTKMEERMQNKTEENTIKIKQRIQKQRREYGKK